MKKSSFILLLLFVVFCAKADDPSSSLEKYGKQLAGSTKNNAITLATVTKTMEQPMRAYQLQFETSAKELMATPNAQKDATAYWTNRAQAEMWQMMFCTDRLKRIMNTFGIDLVSGDLTNVRGETQSMAICSLAS